jgi:hypothetical protein
VVEQETKENWEWFIGLLIKDLDINNNGDGWVFISDQQKVIQLALLFIRLALLFIQLAFLFITYLYYSFS